MGQNTLFQLTFGKITVIGQSKEFGNHRIFDKLQLIRLHRGSESFHLSFYGIFILTCQQPVIILWPDVAVKSAGAPSFTAGFVEIPSSCFCIRHPQKRPEMSPCKILNARVQNWWIRKIQVKFLVISKISGVEVAAEINCQNICQFFNQPFSVLSPCLALLFLFNNTLPY